MRCRAIVIGLVLLLPGLSFGQETKKRPVPSKEAQAKIESLLQELYKDDFARAEKDAAVRARLAQTLLAEGRETKDDAAGRYVLFSKAQQMAAQAGDVATALQAADELARDFVIPPAAIFQLKIKMLQQASAAVGAPRDAYQSVIDRALVVLDDTLEADDYPSSLALIEAASKAAINLKSLPLYLTMYKRTQEILRQQKEFARWQPFADRLAKAPTDFQANYEMGKYYALVKGDWERGLPMLAQGKGEVSIVAGSDLTASKAASGKHAVGLAWLALRKNVDPVFHTQILLRSYYWLQQGLGEANDKTRPQIIAKLKEVNEALPAEHRIGDIGAELARVDLPAGPVYASAFAPDGKRFVVAGYDGALHLFNTKTQKEIRRLDGHAGKVWTVAFAADGKHIVSGGFDGTVRLWDLATHTSKTFDGHKDYVRSVAISADGKWILSGGDDRTVRLWNVSTGKEERVMTGHDHTVWCVALSRDGKRALSASLDKTVRYWDLEKGETIKKLQGHSDTVLCVAFSPYGRHAVSGSSDRTIRLWDLVTGSTLQTFEGSAGYVHSVAIAPDTQRILSAGADGFARLWDAATGQQLRKLEGHRDQIWHVAYSRDGRLAISSGQDNCVRLWTGSR